ncbi:MAG: hypothetical protein WCV68_02005 [Candidatus Paceibacterota bacterium]
MKKYLIALVLVIIVAGAGFTYYQMNKPVVNVPIQKACTEEAKVCPDGSSVGRQGPNCEFAPCPAVASCEGGECPVVKVVTGAEDWKTYKNDQYGFEFKYPNNWFVSTSDDNLLMFTKKYVDSSDKVKQGEEQFLGFVAGEKIVDSKGNKVSKEDYLKFFYPDGCSFGVCFKNEEKEINGLTVLKHEGTLPDGDVRYVFFYGEKVYGFVLYGVPKDGYQGLSVDAYDANDYIKVEKIISTVKFIK